MFMKIRKIVSLMLALVMAAGLLPAAAFADGTGGDQPGSGQPSGPDQPGGDQPVEPDQPGDDAFENLKAALEKGSTYSLTEEIFVTTPETITIPANTESFLDMNSHRVTGVSFVVNGSLSLINGSIDNSLNIFTSVKVNEGGKFTLVGVRIKSGSEYDVYCNNGFFTLNGGSIGGTIYLNRTVMDIAGSLGDNVYKVETETPRVFTNGLSGKGTADNFISADDDYIIGLNGYGEAVIGEPVFVTFIAGESGSSLDIAKGSVPARPEDPVKEGFVFTGWKLENGGYYDFRTPVTGDMTLTAEWEEAPEFMTHSLSLDGKIGVNFFMDLPDIEGVDYSSSFMTFEIGGKGARTETVGFDPEFMSENDEYYGFAFYVSSIQMAETITATYHFFVNGVENTVGEEYSVKEYIYDFDFSGITDETTVNLVHALAYYGYYVQPFLSRVRGWESGKDYAKMDICYGIPSYRYNDIMARLYEDMQNAYSEPSYGSMIESVSYSLTLDSDTAINVYFTPSEDFDGELMFDESAYGKKATLTKCKDGRYRLTVSGIAAHEIGEAFYFTVGTESWFYTLHASAASYVYSALKYYDDCRKNPDAHPETDHETAETGINAVCALYEYWRAAEDYVEVHGGGSD